MWFELDVEHPFGHRTARRFVADSGLRVLVLADDAAPIVSYQTWFRVGSSDETPGSTGIAHLFEHLMFNQTRNLAFGEFDRRIERTGGDTNAATWVDWTYYRNNIPARDLELVIELEAERMGNLTLDEEQIESEREVVINERLQRVEDDVDGFLGEELFRLAFAEHPYHWPTIGWMEDIKRLSAEELRAFYAAHYAPNNATIVVVGDVDETALLGSIERHYGHMPASRIARREQREEPIQQAERRARFVKPVVADRVLVGYKAPSQDHPDWAILDFAITLLLAGGPSSRLHRRLMIDTTIASSAHAALMPFRAPGLLEFSVSLQRGHTAAEAIDEIERGIDSLQRGEIEARELARVKNCAETDFWSALSTVGGRAEALGHYETTLGDFRRLFDVADQLANVTKDEIVRVAREYLVPTRRTIVVAEPAPEPEPEVDA